MYIWKSSNWPKLSWDIKKVEKVLNELTEVKSTLFNLIGSIELVDIGKILEDEVINSSQIEGEILRDLDVRSSIAKKLGLPSGGLPEPRKKEEALVSMLIDATSNYERKLSSELLYAWHKKLFVDADLSLKEILIGSYRSDTEVMKIVSGSLEKEKVHYIAPPGPSIEKEMSEFIDWFNNESLQLDGNIRAALSHFKFVTIHPFDDGNGRLARCISDFSLSQSEKINKRMYSMSNQIRKNRKTYYSVLERTQKGDGDVTEWISFFLEQMKLSIEDSLKIVEKSKFSHRLYRKIAENSLNPRQVKVLQKLLDHYPEGFQGGLTNRKYVSICKISPETAKRDLKKLLDLGFILKNEGKGRSISYKLNISDDI